MQTQWDGWPEGITEDEKIRITDAVRLFLVEDQRSLSTSEIARRLGLRIRWSTPLLDVQDAAVERAARAVGAVQVWCVR